ncbi:MAG: hypothetical protein J4F36_08090 [Nitrosopumilaceae archaeon]|nr:hypothetical protein [Nitrosopumilaceae archaeon]
MAKEKITLEELCSGKNIEYKEDYLEKDCMVIPNSTLSIEDVMLIKKIRQKHNVEIVNFENKQYKDFRGGEYAIATFVVSSVVLPLLVGLLGSFIHEKIQSHIKGKQETGNEQSKPPRFSVSIFNKDKNELRKLEGEPEEVLKALKELDENSDDST